MSDQRFDEAYFRDTYRHEGLRTLGIHWWSVRWYASMAERRLLRDGGRRLLEIGCGHGFLLARLEDRFETCGVDISSYAISRAVELAAKSRCLVANIEDGELPAEFAAGSFDLVLARYVFEHLGDPGKALRRAATLLRPGGTLFISVPNTRSLGARRKGPDWYANKDPTHCSLLPPDRWRQLVTAAGLEIDRESADGWWDVPYFRGLPAPLQLPLVIGPTAIACLSGRAILPPLWGENVLIFARKPRGGTPLPPD